MKRGQREDHGVTQYLNKLLDEMPLHEPSPMLTDRIMHSLQPAKDLTSAVDPRQRANRPWMHGAIAIAATVLLIQSGMISKIVNIASGISQLTDYIQNLSQNL